MIRILIATECDFIVFLLTNFLRRLVWFLFCLFIFVRFTGKCMYLCMYGCFSNCPVRLRFIVWLLSVSLANTVFFNQLWCSGHMSLWLVVG